MFASMFAGRSHSGGREAREVSAGPFIQTKEETSLPACLLGDGWDRPYDGRARPQSGVGGFPRRRPDCEAARWNVPGNGVSDLAASPDGKTLYYVVSGTVWATKWGVGNRAESDLEMALPPIRTVRI